MSILNTLFVGKVAHHFSTLVSTNDFAVELIAKTKPIEGTVISSDYQRAGRGQTGSSWYSRPNKNLLLSIIFFPKWLSPQNQFLLSQSMALAVADAVYLLANIPATVKWPNDVYIQDKKVAGILIQNSLIGHKISWSVIGIGLNINEEKFPSHLPKATSLKMLCSIDFHLKEARNTLIKCVEQRYLQLKSRPEEIAKQYLQQLYQYQSWANYQEVKTGQVFRAQIIGINKNGHLAVQREETPDKIEYFDLKEIIFL